jgi:hypothetical protein
MATSARNPKRGREPKRGDRHGGRLSAALELAGATSPAPGFRVRAAARKSPAIRRRLMLALASAEEELMQRHADAAADFVRDTAGELPFERALSIYMRLVDVPARDRRTVAVRALALLGEAGTAEDIPSEPAARERALDRILRRVRGRQPDELRARVGNAADRARDAALAAHLHGAHDVAAALEGVVGPAEAVQYYIEAMDIRAGWAERVFHEAVGARPVQDGATKRSGRRKIA